jgi:Fe-S-cluster-containing dehydrogenase component
VAFDLFENETGSAAEWLVPAAHYLESWGDARAYDGTASIVQPLIAPLYGGKTAAELLSALLGEGNRSSHELVRDQWRAASQARDFDTFWDEALQRGVIPGTAAPPVRPGLRWNSIADPLAAAPAEPSGMEIVFQPDPSVYDGRFANNAWLQELPDPMTKLTWGNAALLSPATAAKLRLDSGDRLRLRWQGRELTAPAQVLPGMADEVVALRFGYGRGSGGEELAKDVGVSAFRLWNSEMPYGGAGLQLERVSGNEQLATTQTHWSIEDRPIALHATLAEYREHPDFTRRQKGRQLSLYQGPPEGSGDQWAMTIDLSTCTGCSACVVACQAENNIPVVGPEGVLKSREMHWLRIDRYFSGALEDPAVVSQPMLCQHCEKAPCEYVCPVNATAHSPDGLNEMIYNRCVGTRFCSNNCPYKVRRFNWFDYNAELSETERMAKNPDVTVRARGVMEKCTFCVQRIREAQIGAKLEGRPLRDGEVRTACQQACPTGAIVFGSLNDPGSEVLRSREEPRSYAVLHELGTEPRVRYLARITNPNPELQGG